MQCSTTVLYYLLVQQITYNIYATALYLFIYLFYLFSSESILVSWRFHNQCLCQYKQVDIIDMRV